MCIRVPLPQAVKSRANVAVIVKKRVFQVLHFYHHAIQSSLLLFWKVDVNGSLIIKKKLSKKVSLHKKSLMKFSFYHCPERCKEESQTGQWWRRNLPLFSFTRCLFFSLHHSALCWLTHVEKSPFFLRVTPFWLKSKQLLTILIWPLFCVFCKLLIWVHIFKLAGP